MERRTQRRPVSPGQTPLVAAMLELWERGRYNEAASIYDNDGGTNPPPEATFLRARAHLKKDNAPTAIRILEHVKPEKTALSGRRDLILASAHAHVGGYDVADELFNNANAAAQELSDAELAGDVAYYRAQRFLFEHRPDAARELLSQTRAVTSEFGQLRALHLESFILNQEGRHREQARILIELLGRIDPNRTNYMELRAWATYTLATLARELYLPEALPEVERQLGGTEWPPDFDERRFQTLKALGWACALRGDYFNAFRYLKLSSRKATSDAWRAIAAAERAELARCKGENIWSRQELAEAEEYAANVDWNAIRDEACLGLLLLAELFVPIDAAKASYYQARFNEGDNIKAPNFHLKNDPRLTALEQYSSAIVDLAGGHHKVGIERLRSALSTFRTHGYDWRAGRCALRLFEETRDVAYISVASEHLRNYMNCWLGDELRRLSERKVMLPPMQRRVYDALCRGMSTAQIAKELGRSEFTIRNHIKLIFKTFGVNSRAALIANASSKKLD